MVHTLTTHVWTDWIDQTDPKLDQICSWCMKVHGENWHLKTSTGKLAIAYHIWQFDSPEAATQFKLTWGDHVRIYQDHTDT